MSFPLAGAELKARLAAQGFRPSRARGQNFLLDGNLARAIIRDAGSLEATSFSMWAAARGC